MARHRDTRPLTLVAAATAAGAVFAAALPLLRAERRWLQPIGDKLNSAVRRKVVAAGQAAKREFTSSIPVTPAAASATVERVIDQAVSA